MITRKKAVERLAELVNSGILSEGLEDDIEEIAGLIQDEEQGFHGWGADSSEYGKLFVHWREDLWTEERIEECKEIFEKYSFTPSPFEAEETSAQGEEYEEEDYAEWSD